MKLSTGFGAFEKAARARLEGDTGAFWRQLNYWWEWEHEEKPRVEAMRGLELLLQDQDGASVTTSGKFTISSSDLLTSNIIIPDTFGNRWNAKGYWQIGSHCIYTNAAPTRIGAYLARVLLGIRYYSL